MGVEDTSNDQPWDSKSIADLLHQDPGGTEGWRGDILSGKVVDYASDDEVYRRHE